ncbi:MAG: HAD family phosphatase [Chloroflexota bacterium]|nr:HAD family phosphatase [Chloroflexota bacterium]
MIFDLDGTLVDTVDTRIRAWTRALRERGIDADRDQLAELIGADGRLVARRMAEAAGVTLTDADASEVDARSGVIYAELNTDPRSLPGVDEALAELARHRIPWAIATSSRPEQVAASVEALRLRQRPVIVDGGTVTNAKPAPDLLFAAAARLSVPVASAWAVGDAVWDMQAAAAAGATGVGVTTGAASEAALRAHGARVVIGTLAELRDHLGRAR